MYQKLEDHNRLVNKYLTIFFAVAFYWLVSILTVFVNKHLLSSDTINLDAPLFISWIQCVVGTLICVIMGRLGKWYPSIITFPEGNLLDVDTFRKILPLSVVFTLMVGSNNIALKYVGVAFYYIGRSLTTVFNVLLSYFLLRQETTFKCLICCAGIVFGFWLGVDQESLTDAFSLRGTIFGVLGSFLLAMYSIQTKKALNHVNQEIWLLTYYNNFYSCFLFLPLIILNGELEPILTFNNLFESWFIGAMLIGGLCGFTIGFATMLQIKVTSPLTHNVSGTAKACAQTVIATQFYNDKKSALWWASNGIVLLSSMAYTRVKQIEMQREHNRKSGLSENA